MRSVRKKYNELKEAQRFTKACKYVQTYVNEHIRKALADHAKMEQADIALGVERALGKLEDGGLIVRHEPRVISFTVKLL